MTKVAQNIFIFLLYIYAVAIFSSLAGLTLFGNLMLPISCILAVAAFRKGEFKLLPSQKFLLALVPWSIFTLWINGEMAGLADELGTFNRMIVAVLAMFPLAWFLKSDGFGKHIKRLGVIFLVCVCVMLGKCLPDDFSL